MTHKSHISASTLIQVIILVVVIVIGIVVLMRPPPSEVELLVGNAGGILAL
jgi:preprotein translocase subunit SecG